MTFFKKAIYRLINGKQTITNTIFIKEFEKENQQLKDLTNLSNKVFTSKKEFIDRDASFIKYGLDGEQNVYYELKNSFIPMLCLHDIRLEYKDYVAQFDFIVITSKFIYVLETKNLNGDIEITKDGDFIRTIKSNSGKIIKKEGMYSPISQNKRHIDILKEVLIKENLVKTIPIKSAVIMANAKTIVNKNKAPKVIRENIHKYDQVVNLLKKELNNKKNDKNMLEKYMYAIAEFLLKNNKTLMIDYIRKYSLTEKDFIKNEQINYKKKDSIKKKEINETKKISKYNFKINNSQIYDLLKNYRLNTSKKEEIKPYFIFNNEQLDLLVKSKPKSKAELLQIKGFGQKKVEKYGDSILSIINRL